MPGVRALALSLALLPLLVGSVACSERPPAPTAAFVAGTEQEALARVRAFLDAYQAADVDAALAVLCERDAATRAFLERSLAPGSPFRISRYEIRHVTPLWERKQPYYLVGVLLPRRAGAPVEHGYRVRAADGCIERLFGGLLERAPFGSPAPEVSPGPQHPPVTPPAGAPHALPDEPGERAEETPWQGDDEAWGPPLPAAPTAPGDEVIDL